MINSIPQYNIYQQRFTRTQPTFKGNPVQTLTHTNIGSCLEGYIGKIRVRKGSNNQECFLDVFKKFNLGAENYSIKNDKGELIGEVDVKINRFEPGTYDTYTYPTNPSHVFVDNLRNYSRPQTPYHNKRLEYFKDIGIRLLQIAQRRSDEANCYGNIKLISKDESKKWYVEAIGMLEEFPPIAGFKFRVGNPNSMILPPHSKEPLSRLNGGL